MSDMNKAELGEILDYLGLDLFEAAQLLGIGARSMQRWLLEGEEIPGPAIVALRAWRAMHARQLNWKPDTQSLFADDQDQIIKNRNHIVDIDAAVGRVEKRGGPNSPWIVDLEKKTAIFGPFEVNFYHLRSDGGFSLSCYRRRDGTAEINSDMSYLEDAAFCIAKKISMTRAAEPALRTISEYTRANSSNFRTDGPKMPTAAQIARRKQDIEMCASRIDKLAADIAIGRGSYAQFEDILIKLNAAGFLLPMDDILAVAKAMA